MQRFASNDTTIESILTRNALCHFILEFLIINPIDILNEFYESSTGSTRLVILKKHLLSNLFKFLDAKVRKFVSTGKRQQQLIQFLYLTNEKLASFEATTLNLESHAL